MKLRLYTVTGIFCAMLFSIVEATVTLTPNGDASPVITPVDITSYVISPIAVSGSPAGFLLICEANNSNLDTISYDLNSQSWGSVIQTPNSTTNINTDRNGPSPTLVCNIPQGAMATWLSDTVGFASGYAYAGFTTNGGMSWDPFSLVSATYDVFIVGVSGTYDGFMFVWYDYGSNLTPYWAWATHSGSSWSVASSGTIPNPTGAVGSPALVSGTIDTGFMAAWVNQDSNVYASYSNNEGGMWTTQKVSTSGDVDYVWIAGNSKGFMAVWVDSFSNVYSSFYDLNSGSWQESPILIGSNVNTNNNSPFVTGNDTGFVVSYIDSFSNVFGVASTSVGTEWTSPVPITVAANVVNQGLGTSDLVSIPWFAGAGMIDDTVLFTWLDTDGNVQSRFYTITVPVQSTPRSFSRPSNRR